MEHQFTKEIKDILAKHFGNAAEEVFERNPLLQYLNIKTRSASRGSKARGSFANIYAVFVLVEHYLQNSFDKKGDYANSEGAKFSELFERQRELPFGSKLQNHALNHRLNEEFRKYFPRITHIPVLRNVETNRYWFNENLLKTMVSGKSYNLAKAVLAIVHKYISAKQNAFEAFIQACNRLKRIGKENETEAKDLIVSLLAPHVDARLFEIISYAILKFYYHDQKVYFGFDLESIRKEGLKLYKTGRTNANDGGIDFVMKPLGRFFQVTETLDVKKYFLDIDKIERYPISFVIKSEESLSVLREKIKQGAEKQYLVKPIVKRYMDCIEEVINIPVLKARFNEALRDGYLRQILDEIIVQSKIEFNYQE
ncbi:MAG: restriction endonuclease [candidate division KSB1 bacterium]